MDSKTVSRSNFISDVASELKKVSWPSREETFKLTAIVFIICLIVAVYLGIIDFSLAKVLEFLTH